MHTDGIHIDSVCRVSKQRTLIGNMQDRSGLTMRDIPRTCNEQFLVISSIDSDPSVGIIKQGAVAVRA